MKYVVSITKNLILLLSIGFLFTSCFSYQPIKVIEYRSIRPTAINDTEPPEEASIAIGIVIAEDPEEKGCSNVFVGIRNLTDQVMVIDQTKSFFIKNKTSTAYYDPTVKYNTYSKTDGAGKAGSFNLGGITSALGIGGALGSLANATTIGQSRSTAQTHSSTTVTADLPQISIGPKGTVTLSRTFQIKTGDAYFFADGNEPKEKLNMTPDDSDISCSIHISYSLDDGETYETISSAFFSNAYIRRILNSKKHNTNEVIREILRLKPNITLEPWFFLRTYHQDGPYGISIRKEDQISTPYSQIFNKIQ